MVERYSVKFLSIFFALVFFSIHAHAGIVAFLGRCAAVLTKGREHQQHPHVTVSPSRSPKDNKANWAAYVANWRSEIPRVEVEGNLRVVEAEDLHDTIPRRLYRGSVGGREVHGKALVRHSESIPRELAFMKICQENEIKTVPFLGYAEVDGLSPVLMTGFIPGTLLKLHDGILPFKSEGGPGKITKETRRQVFEALDKLGAAGIEPYDVQFIVDKNGDAYMLDTHRFYFPDPNSSEPKDMQLKKMRKYYEDFFKHQLR